MPTTTWDNLPAERRERVVVAAMREFGRCGYSGGSLTVVAREAGVAKGSLFQYFPDKLDFFSYVAEYTSIRVRNQMTRWLAALDPERPFFEFMLELMLAWMRYYDEHPLERGVTAATNLELDPQVRVAVREPVNRIYVAALHPFADRARERGELHPEADLDAFVALLVILLPHFALAPHLPGLDVSVRLYGVSDEERTDAARRLLLGIFAGFGRLPDGSDVWTATGKPRESV
ncbi:TetR/AcrR family transcriptional regulator [Fodinicola feengrottensis]|uniref:TetR/AcrR family transcriptional regulator n=1 Tax=Fodinicola feengrottensis TaxID=435914 RepID=A0ABN2FXH3_9ACTN